MFQELGTPAGILILMLYLSVCMDAFVIFNIMVRKIASASEYTAAVLKWAKISILFIAAAVIFFFTIFGGYSLYVTIVMAILGTLLAADGVLSTIIKKKYGKKK